MVPRCLLLVVFGCSVALGQESDQDGAVAGLPDWFSEDQTGLKVASLKIRSDITYRFATTLVSSTVRNYDNVSREATFDVRLPKSAFISNFSMIIDGKLYLGNVKEKEAAKKQYERAKKKGQSAGHVVKAKPRDTERFKVTVNVAATSETHFNLTYQELLQRKFGKYEHVIYIDPGEPVPDMRVDVFIQESREITDLFVPPIRNDLLTESTPTGRNELVVIDQPSEKSAHVLFMPSVDDQLKRSQQGISGQFVVSYDVTRKPDAGEILAVDGYFVHFFAPKGLKPLPKRILFVLDVSGSMGGQKINQLRQAMNTILDDLREGDEFNIMKFSGGIKFWRKGRMVTLNNATLAKAKVFVSKLSATGSTNINLALTDGIKTLGGDDTSSNKALIVMFLTDGQPSAGVTDKNTILRNAKATNEGGVAVFSLAFGVGADYNLVQQLSAQNFGVARKIYEDSDAHLQLKGFYDEISTPVLSNVTVRYLGDSVSNDTVTSTDFHSYFEGTEVIVAGKLTLGNTPTLDLSIKGDDSQGDFVIGGSVDVQPSPATSGEIRGFTEKLWAYLTIRQIMEKTLAVSDPAELSQLRKQALDLSLKYGFVTPLTSMVVTKPESEEVADDSETAQDAPGSNYASSPGRQAASQSAPQYSPGGGGGGGGGGSYGGGDPHFIVHVKGLTRALCFDVSGADGDVFQLLADKQRDIFVNGKVFGATVPVGWVKKNRTYFGDIVMIHGKHRLTVAPNKIRLDDTSYSWREKLTFVTDDIRLSVNPRKNVTVNIGHDISFAVSRQKKKKVKFMEFSVTDGHGLSPDVSGIMGEFEYKNITEDRQFQEDGEQHAVFTVHRQHGSWALNATLGHRLNMAADEHVTCWRIKKTGKGVLDHSAPDDYLLKELLSTEVLNVVSKKPDTGGIASLKT